MSALATSLSRTQSFMADPSFRRGRTLLLDYDGTLAPFVADRSRAYPYPALPFLLDEIIEGCKTRVVIISGRQANEVSLLLQTRSRPEIWGCHGLERLSPSGEYSCMRLDSESEAKLTEVMAKLRNAGLEPPHTEIKPGCVAVHWRPFGSKKSEEIKALAYRCLGAFAGRANLVLCDFDGGLELRHRACNKRHAVDTILHEIDANTAIAYMGDDATDEEAFRALNGRGLTVLVRPTYHFTAAQTWLRPPSELSQFLTDWIQTCRGDQ